MPPLRASCPLQGRSGIDRQQRPHAPGPLHAACEFAGRIAGAGEQVGAHSARDGRAHILREHQPVERLRRGRAAVVRLRGGQPHRQAQRDGALVHRDAAHGREGHAQGTDGAALRVGVERGVEKHHARVGGQHFGHFSRVHLRPGADDGHGDRAVHPPGVEQPAADRFVGPAVGAGVAQPQGLAAGQTHEAGALYLQEQGVHRAVEPDHGVTIQRGL